MPNELKEVERLAREVSETIDEDSEDLDSDQSALLRDLRLAFVQLDMARSREADAVPVSTRRVAS